MTYDLFATMTFWQEGDKTLKTPIGIRIIAL